MWCGWDLCYVPFDEVVAYFSNGEVLWFLIECGDISLEMGASVSSDRAVAYILGRMVAFFRIGGGVCISFDKVVT